MDKKLRITDDNWTYGSYHRIHYKKDMLYTFFQYVDIHFVWNVGMGTFSLQDRLVERLLGGELPGIKDAFLANAQSKVLLVEFDEPIAEQVLEEAEKLGAAPNPIGAESRYELVPMFYRVSGTFRATDPTITKRMIRINPMRSGDDTVIRILKEAMEKVR